MILNIIFIIVIVILAAVLWKYQRQMKDICRQIAFLREHDSNMLITTQIQAGGVSELAEELNELLLERKRERREYFEKETATSGIYTLSLPSALPISSLPGTANTTGPAPRPSCVSLTPRPWRSMAPTSRTCAST